MMEARHMPDYTRLDNSPAMSYIVYPRETFTSCPKYGFDHFVPVGGAEEAVVHCRFYKNDDNGPWILYFHGNGEVVSDYDEIAIFFFKYGLNLTVVDYRGYGKSTGEPTVTNIVSDALAVYESVKSELANRGHNSRVWIMGRSLGSIPALAIANRYKDEVPGLVIESGFPSIARLLWRLNAGESGADLDVIDRDSIAVVREINVPVLVIHGEYDTLVPPEEAETLFEEIGSKDKEYLLIPGAGHNDIMFLGLKQYMEAIKALIDKTG